MAFPQPLFGIIDDIRATSKHDPEMQHIRAGIREGKTDYSDYEE